MIIAREWEAPLIPGLELFSDKHLLFVGDCPLMSEPIERQMRKLGAIIIGPLQSATLAIDYLQLHHVDAAILDISLDSESVFPLVEGLMHAATPFIFVNGFDRAGFARDYPGFSLSANETDLASIAVALFAPQRLTQ